MKILWWIVFAAVAGWGSSGVARGENPEETGRWWSEGAERAVEQAGENALELRRALRDVPEAERGRMEFLVENLPERDRRGLSAESLLDNVGQASAGLAAAPWGRLVPEDVFRNEVLPYANASEQREAWRAELRGISLPLIVGCVSPAAAARRLNEELFDKVNVHYSTGRARADQSPSESIASGKASCTGLSILLVDACRSVGVPARLVGIPDWADGRGNHTWVEVWDAGQWHFLGAGEPDKRGLDHAWFERDAALAQKDSPRHAIYAVSFRRTELPFPLAWGPDSGGVSAENVTERYTTGAEKGSEAPAAATTARVMFRVREREGGPRVAATVRVSGITDTGLVDPTLVFSGTSKDETADTNDLLGFDLPRGHQFFLSVMEAGSGVEQHFVVPDKAQEVMKVILHPTASDRTGQSQAVVVDPATIDATTRLRTEVPNFFKASKEQQATWKFDSRLDDLLRENPASVRRTVWENFRRAAVSEVAADLAAKQVSCGGYVSPYTVREVGTKPAEGWGLVIAMHGGGGAPKEVNDSQWRIMQSYYRDQPQLGGYLYVALRAPNDTWNGFYDDYVYPLVARLIRQFAVTEETNPDKVFLIGYSHGGYGAFAIGPKMADRFAAIHSSAAAPTDGLISAKTLRHTPFDFAVGEFDDAYDRRKRCEAFAREVASLRGVRTDIFPVTFHVETGRHHSDLPDHDQLRAMLPLTRQPVPRDLTWEETDGVVRGFYWLEDRQPQKGREIDAACEGNRLSVQARGAAGKFTVLLDERLVDLGKPLVVEHGRESESVNLQPSLRTLCETMVERGDPELAFTCRLEFELDAAGRLRMSGVPPR